MRSAKAVGYFVCLSDIAILSAGTSLRRLCCEEQHLYQLESALACFCCECFSVIFALDPLRDQTEKSYKIGTEIYVSIANWRPKCLPNYIAQPLQVD